MSVEIRPIIATCRCGFSVPMKGANLPDTAIARMDTCPTCHPDDRYYVTVEYDEPEDTPCS